MFKQCKWTSMGPIADQSGNLLTDPIQNNRPAPTTRARQVAAARSYNDSGLELFVGLANPGGRVSTIAHGRPQAVLSEWARWELMWDPGQSQQMGQFIAAAQNQDGHMEAFLVSGAGAFSRALELNPGDWSTAGLVNDSTNPPTAVGSWQGLTNQDSIKPLVVGRNQGGRLEAFGFGSFDDPPPTAGDLRHLWQKTPPATSQAWDIWCNGLGTTPNDPVYNPGGANIKWASLDVPAPTIGSPPSGKWAALAVAQTENTASGNQYPLELFAVDDSNKELWHTWQTAPPSLTAPEGTWANWEPMNAIKAGQADGVWLVAAARNYRGRVEVFAVDTHDYKTVWWNVGDGGGSPWKEWKPFSVLDCEINSLAIAQDADNCLKLFAVLLHPKQSAAKTHVDDQEGDLYALEQFKPGFWGDAPAAPSTSYSDVDDMRLRVHGTTPDGAESMSLYQQPSDSLQPGTKKLVASNLQGSFDQWVTGLVPDTHYTFWFNAINADGVEVESDPAPVTTEQLRQPHFGKVDEVSIEVLGPSPKLAWVGAVALELQTALGYELLTPDMHDSYLATGLWPGSTYNFRYRIDDPLGLQHRGRWGSAQTAPASLSPPKVTHVNDVECTIGKPTLPAWTTSVTLMRADVLPLHEINRKMTREYRVTGLAPNHDYSFWFKAQFEGKYPPLDPIATGFESHQTHAKTLPANQMETPDIVDVTDSGCTVMRPKLPATAGSASLMWKELSNGNHSTIDHVEKILHIQVTGLHPDTGYGFWFVYHPQRPHQPLVDGPMARMKTLKKRVR
jgi:hypothetical protein